MKRKLETASSLLLAGLMLNPLLSVAKEGTPYSVLRSDTAGTSYKDLGSVADRTCFLSGFQLAETDVQSEWVACNVSRYYQNWYLTATIGRGSDEYVWCAAICVPD